MGDISFNFTIQGDSEGYIIFECTFCKSQFKLAASELQSKENPVTELFCPYCGLVSDKNDFYTEEVIEEVKKMAMNYAIEQFNNSFGKMARSINNSSKSVIKMKFKPLKKLTVNEIKVNDTTEEEFQCSCCDNHIKVLYCVGVSKVFCSYCGVDII